MILITIPALWKYLEILSDGQANFEKIGLSWDLTAGETRDEAGVYFGAVRANKSEDPRIPVADRKMDG
jgi:hypothetical protein